MDNNNYLSASVFAAVALAIGLLIGSHFAPAVSVAPSQPSASYVCTNDGTSCPASSLTSAATGKFGSGTESSTFLQSGSSSTFTGITGTGTLNNTSGLAQFGSVNATQITDTGAINAQSFNAQNSASLSLQSNGSTVATSTSAGGSSTSTWSFPGHTCFNVYSTTGTQWSVTFDNGTFNGKVGQCAN